MRFSFPQKLSKVTHLILVQSLLITASTAFSETLTLQQALSEASHSPQVSKAEAYRDEIVWKKVEAVSAFLPTITGNINYLTNKKYALTDIDLGGSPASVPQIVPTTNYTLSARWNVFDGFASTNRFWAAQAFEKSANLEYDWAKFQTDRQVLLAYYKFLAAEQVKLVAEQNLKALKDHAKDVEALKKAGMSTQYDLLRTQVQYSEAEAEAVNADDQIANARNKLAEVLGKDVEDRTPTGNLPVLTADLISKKKTTAKKLDLLALQKRSEGLNYSAHAMSRHWIPKVSLFADYSFYNNRTDEFDYQDEAFRESYLVGATLSWELFNGFGSMAKSGQAEAQALQLEKTTRMADLKAKNDLDFWTRKYNYYISLYKSKTTDIDRSNEAARLAKVGRKAGMRTNTEVLDAQADVFRSKAAQINAQIGAIEALVNIELATGETYYSFIQ
ncbi:MAG: TolC family protein [Pseudobdellovibrio sp.]|nr:TolC family protein [Pseudobdellovibrio sp.]